MLKKIFEKKYTKGIFLNLKNAFYYMGGNVIQLLIAIFTLPIFSKYLSPKDFAILGYYTSINAFFAPLFNLSLHSYYLTNYYSNKTHNENDELSYAINALNLANILIGIVGFFVVSLYFSFFNVQFPIFPYLVIILLYLFFNKYKVFFLVDCRIQKKGLSYFFLSASVVILNVVFSLFFVISLNGGAVGKMSGQLVSHLIVAILIMVLWIKNKKFKFYLSFNKEKIKDSFKFAWPLVVASYSYFPINNFDKIFLERLHNINEFGYYNVGFIVASYVGVFFYALYQSFEPDLYRFIYKNQKKKYIIFILGYGMISFSVTLLFIIFSKFILSFLTSGRYTRASVYANIFIVGLFLQRMGGFFEPIFNAKRVTKYILKINMIIGGLSIITYYYLINYLGFKGATFSRVLISIFYIVISSLFFYKYIHSKHIIIHR